MSPFVEASAGLMVLLWFFAWLVWKMIRHVIRPFRARRAAERTRFGVQHGHMVIPKGKRHPLR